MSKSKRVAYWATTGLISFVYLSGGVMDLRQPPDVVTGMSHLGYPLVLATILGVWKLLAVPALLAPGLPRLKEWAYAGILFNTTSASISHASVGDDAGMVATPLIILLIALASWALRPESRRLGTLFPFAAREGAAGVELGAARN